MAQPQIRRLVEGVLGGAPCAIGDYRQINGKVCKIVDGAYWGKHGLSNFWYFRVVLPSGRLGPVQSSYGGKWPLAVKPKRRE